ncbi:MAG: FAD-binding oxidoreductase [Acidimicrobiales bacterium]
MVRAATSERILSDLARDLAAIVGPEHVLTDADLRRGYEIDWTGEYRGVAAAVVRPSTTEEVAAVLRRCHDAGVPVVPQGGNTGLVGGSVPDATGTAVVVSTTRLRERGPVEALSGQVTVGAGVTLAAVQQHVRPLGFDVAVDFAAREAATLGGMVATNAGGVHVLRHGATRHQVVGIEAVLADGSVLSHLTGVVKDNTGYDLAGLLCGSEGTLGVITRVRLRLIRVQPHRVTAMLAFPDVATMVEGLGRVRASVPGLDVAEYVVRRGVELVMSTFGTPDPFSEPHEAYLLIEASGATDPAPSVAAALATDEVAVATSSRHRDALWALRELHTAALARAGPPRKYDVSVPVDQLAEFLDEAVDMVERRPGATCHHFGHLGDGNVHLNVLGEGAEELDAAVLGLVASRGGSISAEHGIGRLKRPWLHLSRTPQELAAFRAIKTALDGRGILNPGVLLAP